MLLADLIKALYGSFRLMRGDRAGITYFPTTGEGARRSFVAYLIILPVWMWIYWPQDAQIFTGSPVTAQHYAALVLCQIMISVFFFYLVVERLTRQMKCRHRFPLYVSAQNWSGVALVVPIVLLHLVVKTPPSWFDHAIQSLAILFSWFITYTSLRITPVMAFGLCVLEMLAEQLVSLLLALFMTLTLTVVAAS